MSKDPWQRFYNYEKASVLFFLINLAFILVNEEINLIPFEISGYFFWLSLGLYLGFRLAKSEMIRVQKKLDERERTEDNFFSKN